MPKRTDITPADPREEPTRYYYWPVVGWFYRKRLHMVLDALGPRHFPRLLEVAYGSGIFLPSLKSICDELYGLDLLDRLDLVQETLRKAGVSAHLRIGDALAMPYPNEHFDVVVNVSMLEHLKNPAPATHEMLRVLKPGGVAVLGFPCRNPWMDAFFRVLGYDPQAIHPSSHRDILAAINARGVPVVCTTFPARLPLDISLYCVCALQKNAREP